MKKKALGAIIVALAVSAIRACYAREKWSWGGRLSRGHGTKVQRRRPCNAQGGFANGIPSSASNS
jgi:hypothetical protein